MTRARLKDLPYTALAVACNYSFAFLWRFLQYVMFLTEADHTNYSNLDFHYQMMDKFSSALANITAVPGLFW